MRSRGAGALLLGLGVGWGAGNVGPVVLELGAQFHTTLAAVGLLSGTVYFGAALDNGHAPLAFVALAAFVAAAGAVNLSAP